MTNPSNLPPASLVPVDLVKALRDRGFKGELAGEVEPLGMTPLVFALESGFSSDMVRRLCEMTPHANHLVEGRKGLVSPLTLACERGDAGLVLQLLEQGADPNLRVRYGYTPLKKAVSGASSCAMTKLPDFLEIMTLLVRFGGKPGLVGDEKKISMATQPSLFYADRPEIIDHLVSLGADVREDNGHGSRLIHHVAMNGKMDLVRHLVNAHGVDPCEQNSGGETLLTLVLENTLTGERPEAEAGLIDRVGQLLEMGLDVNAGRWSEITPLMIAAYHAPCAIPVLLEAGADMMAVDEDGNDALYWAFQQQQKHRPLVEIMFADFRRKQLAAVIPEAKDPVKPAFRL
jgi:ankyrin repeat protein